MNLLKLNQIKIVTILSCAIVPLLITGPFLPDLFLSLLSLWFLYYVFSNKLYYVFKNKFFYLFLVFCFVCILSSLLSDNVLLSFESSLFYFRIGIFCLLISYLIDKDKNILNYFFYTLIVTFVFLIVYAFIQYIFELNVHPVRVSSFFGNELILGSYLSRLLPLIVALFLINQNQSLLRQNLFIIFLFSSYLTIILSGERSAFFYVNMSFLFILFFVRPNLKIFFSSIIVGLIAFILFYISTLHIKSGKNLIERFTNNVRGSMNLDVLFKKNDKSNIENQILDIQSDNVSKTGSEKKRFIIFSYGHETLYRTAFNMFLDRPIIGHGPKMFRIKCSDPKYAEVVGTSERGISSCMTHPHNFYIQLLAETGLIGFSILFFLFLYVVYLSMKYFYYDLIKKKKIYSNYNICLLACLLITVWPIIPNGNFFNNHLMIIYSLPLGFFRKKF